MPRGSLMLLNSVYLVPGQEGRSFHTVLGVWFCPTKDAPDRTFSGNQPAPACLLLITCADSLAL